MTNGKEFSICEDAYKQAWLELSKLLSESTPSLPKNTIESEPSFRFRLSEIFSRVNRKLNSDDDHNSIQPCDAVSREAILDIFDAYEAAELDHHVPRMLYSRVVELPSVTPKCPPLDKDRKCHCGFCPERLKGEWIKDKETPYHNFYFCSLCGRRIEVFDDIDEFPFCHCGADMRGGEDV